MSHHWVPRTQRAVAALLAVLVVISVPAVARAHPDARGRDDRVRSWVTDLSADERLAAQPVQPWSTVRDGRAPAGAVITVDPTRRYQQMTGFGASMTDSAAYVLSGLPARQREQTMRELFSPTEGIGLSMLRNPMGASDLARRIYSYDDQPAGQTDPRLREFSLAHDRAAIIPRIAEAKRLNPDLVTMGTPWSPPGWMKTGSKDGTMVGGTLQPRYQEAYARYFVKYLQGYARAGIPVDFVSAQNEPLYSPADYPGMFLGPDEEATFIADHLGPAIARSGQDTKILGYDHNWDIPAYPEQLVADQQTDRYLAGTAWHCYAGEATAQTVSHNAFPDTPAYLTECSGGVWQGTTDQAFATTMNLMIGVPRNWGQSVVLWSLALDQRHGPYVGGCDVCRGVVTVNDDGTVTKELEYYALGQTTRFVRPGAVRVASSQAVRADATGQPRGLVDVAYTNPDGSGVLVAYNSGSTAQRFSIRVGDRYVTTSLAAGAAGTWTWSDPGRVAPVDPFALGSVDLDLGRGPAGTPTGRLVQTVSPDVVAAMNQVRVGGQWLAYSLPYGASLRTGSVARLPRTGWSVTTSCPGQTTCAEDASPPTALLDGDPSTRWSSGTGQTDGMSVTLDLGAARTYNQVQLDVGSNIGDFVRRYEVQTSTDGSTWTPVARGQGTSGRMVIAVPSTTSRYLRIVSRTGAGSWWSITELNLGLAAATHPSPTHGLRTDVARLADGSLVIGRYNPGRRDATVALPVIGMDYDYVLPPRTALTFAVWPA